MDGWVKWLGEIVWRLTQWPAGVKGAEREENFWYRTYGVISLILSLVIGLWLVGKFPGPVSNLVILATTYTGADKLLAQGYIGVMLALVIGIPMVVCGVFLLATTILLFSFVLVAILKGLGVAIGWAVTKYLQRHPEAQAAATGAVIGLLIGWFAGLYLARSRAKQEVAAAKEPVPAPKPSIPTITLPWEKSVPAATPGEQSEQKPQG